MEEKSNNNILLWIVGAIIVFLVYNYNANKTSYSDASGIQLVWTDGEISKYSNGSMFYYSYSCTQDCSGHKAGGDWAMNEGIIDPLNCPYDRGDSFGEGCKAVLEAINNNQDR